jgi:hypothetical protein
MAETTTPRRYKTRDKLTMDEELATVQAERRGDSLPKFETVEYRRYRSDVLREGGLDTEAAELETDEPVPLADQSVGEHFDRISGPP